jgi:hexosaminidase
VGKVLAEFSTKTAGWLHDRGRTVVFWGEHPLQPGDIDSLPAHLVNGETCGPQFDAGFARRGIQSMIYTSTEGEERQFPEYFLLPAGQRLHPRRGEAVERVAGIARKIASDPARSSAKVMGAINAGWADAGVHPETFWLGYAAGTAAAWNPAADRQASMQAFYRLFYGPHAVDMERVYRLMSGQAQFWNDSWDVGPSKSRKPIWGNSNSIFNPKRPAQDQFLSLHPELSAELAYHSNWSADQARRLEVAAIFSTQNDELSRLLETNLQRADFNRYNLEIFLSIARLCRQNLEMLADLGRMDELLASAAPAAGNGPAGEAVAAVDRALAVAQDIRRQRNTVLRELTANWYRNRYPRVEAANGRQFLHQLDDVKDHLGDRTVDLSYMVLREVLLPFGEWVDQIRQARNQYAAANGLPANSQVFDWKNLVE